MKFKFHGLIEKATKEYLDNIQKNALIGKAEYGKEIDLSGIGELMAIAAKGDATLATGLSNQIIDPAQLFVSDSTPFLNLVSQSTIPTAQAAEKHTARIINKLLRQSMIDSLASEGKRVGSEALTSVPRDFVPHTWGVEGGATYEAVSRSGAIADPITIVTMLMQIQHRNKGEFNHLLRARTGIGSAAAATPTVAPSATGGALPSGAYGVVVAPLSAAAMYEYEATGLLPVTFGRVNKGDSSTTTVYSGVGRKSAAQSATVTAGDAGTLTCSVPSIRGAFGYAWFAGLSGAVRLHAVTTINSVIISAPAAVDAQAVTLYPDLDHSADPLASDGQFSQIIDPAYGGYVNYLPAGTAGTGTKLTKSGFGNSVTQIDDALLEMLYKGITPDVIMCAPDIFQSIAKLLRTETPAATVLENVKMVYPNNTGSGVNISIITSLKMPKGCIYLHSTSTPMANVNVANTVEIKMQRAPYIKNWVPNVRSDEIGMYAEGFIQCNVPDAFGLILNVAT